MPKNDKNDDEQDVQKYPEDRWDINAGAQLVGGTTYPRRPTVDYGHRVPRDYVIEELLIVNPDPAAILTVIVNGDGGSERRVQPNSTLTIDKATTGPIRFYTVRSDVNTTVLPYVLEQPRGIAGTRVKAGF